MSSLESSSSVGQSVAKRWPLRIEWARSLIRADGWLILGLTVAAWALATLTISLSPPPACIVGEKEDVGCTRGFQARERDEVANRTFRWTDNQSQIVLTGAGYGSARAVALDMAAGRPPEVALPNVGVNIGDTTVNFVPSVAPRRYSMLLPASALGGDVTRLTIGSDTMTARDGRDVGVVIYAARMVRLNNVALAGPLLALAFLSVALSGALIGMPLQPNAAARSMIGSALLGLAAMLSLVATWRWHPIEVAPLVPGAAVLLGIATLGLRRLARKEATFSSSTLRAGEMAILLVVIIGVCIINGLLDWTIMEGIAKRRQIPWVVIGQTIVTLAAFWWLGRVARKAGFSFALVLAAALAVRLFALAVRVLTGRVPNDADTELFYNYGRATIELGVPNVEYPSGALVVWATLALPGSRELFLLFVPLLNLLCDLVIAGGIWWIGARATQRDGDRTASLVASYAALCYALSPLLLPFWHTKFDPLPAALVILALVAYAAERPWWTGIALGVGGAVKWVPWVAVPFPGWAYLRPSSQWPNWKAVGWYVAGVVVSVAALSLPFILQDWYMFLAPYRFQTGRQFIGESIWYPFALLFEPELQLRDAPPYAGMPSAYLSNGLMVGVQLGALALLGLLQVIRPQHWRRTLVLTALAPAVFLLLNRVFSPQFMLIIVACFYAAAPLLFSLRQVVLLTLLITLMEAANLLVWPYTQSYWLWPSILLFTIGVGIAVWLTIGAARVGRQGDMVTNNG